MAATFEEFVREMAREQARAVVASASSFSELPAKLASTAWKRTMDSLSKVKFDGVAGASLENVFATARARFSTTFDFCNGDLSKDIYRDLIHNENNMRPGEINSLFKISGLNDVCAKVSDKTPLLDQFGETDWGKAHGKLLSGLNDFFERRNEIAHALNPGRSGSPDRISKDIDLLENFARALCETLSANAPPPFPVEPVATP